MNTQNQNTISRLPQTRVASNAFDLRFALMSQTQAFQTRTVSNHDFQSAPASASAIADIVPASSTATATTTAAAVADTASSVAVADIASSATAAVADITPAAAASVARVPERASQATPLRANSNASWGYSSHDSDPLLLYGLGIFVHFLLDAETDHLCGVPHGAHSAMRMNYRLGYYRRRLSTPLGTIFLRVPHLLYFQSRVSIAKRAKRVSPQIFDSLRRVCVGAAVRDEAALLIKTLWTLKLPGDLLDMLAEKLVPILEQWRDAAIENQSMHDEITEGAVS